MEVTIKEIAKECGVGISTVSRAINNHPDINPETKTRVLETIERMHYIPNNSARNLKMTDSKTIAALVKGITNPFFNDMISVLEEKIEKKNYSFVLQRVEENEDELDVALHLEKEKRLSGLIFLGGTFSNENDRMKQLNIPFVLCTVGGVPRQENPKISSVSVDDYKESYKMVDYLCSAGHKRIAMLKSWDEERSIGYLRYKGYVGALKAHGLEPQKELVISMNKESDHYDMETGYRLTKQLIETTESFDALYCTSDSLAFGALRAMHEAGISVPEQCVVAGFDGLEMGKYYSPTLTTIEQPTKEMAAETAKALFEEMEKGTHIQWYFDAKLVVRESTENE